MDYQLLVSATFLEAPARFQPHQPLERPERWLSSLEQRNSETNEEACHLMVFQVLCHTGVPTPWTAGSQLDSLEGWTNPPGVATGSGKAPGPVSSQVLPQWVEEETDHLLGVPRKGASDRENWGFRRREQL